MNKKPTCAMAIALTLFLAAPGPALAMRAADPNAGEWTSGYQMGQFWAAGRLPSGDTIRFTCLDEDARFVKKGASISIEFAAIAEARLKPGEPVDVGFGADGVVKTLPMIVEEGSVMSLADLPADRAEAARLIAALKRGKVLTVTFGQTSAFFGLDRSRKALEAVIDCAKSVGG